MIIHAPWTAEQVNNLEQRQQRHDMHPYTCKCGTTLLPQIKGWYCSLSGLIEQKWAHDHDVNGSFLDRETFHALLDKP